jgi:Ca-activated chloride channel family protein
MDLDAIYTKRIRGKMEATAIKGGRKQIFEDRYQWPLAVAVVLIILELFIASITPRGLAVFAALLLIGLPSGVQAGSFQEGLKAYEKGDYDNALKLFIDAQIRDPDRPALLYNIGNAYYKTGDYESAYRYFNQALSSDDDNLRYKAQYNLGNTSFRRGALEEAIQHYEAALKIDPNDEQARQNIDFIKQIMQQQQNQSAPHEGSDREDNQNNRQPGEQPQHAPAASRPEERQQQPDSRPTPQDAESSSPQFGQQMGQDNPAGAQETGERQENPQDEAAAANDTPRPVPRPEDRQQAQRMLNRLQDQPGRAAVPFYQKRKVEKDW